MPTHEELDRFWRDYALLTPQQVRQFRAAVRKFIEDLPSHRFRAGLRVRDVEGHAGVWEMTWAGDGRATFEYGPAVRDGEPHIIWRRVGTHAIFQDP